MCSVIIWLLSSQKPLLNVHRTVPGQIHYEHEVVWTPNGLEDVFGEVPMYVKNLLKGKCWLR